MLTQCPECKTTFRLNLTQLKAAGGKVRCSRCRTVFDALDNLFEQPSPAEQPTPELPVEESEASAAEPIKRHEVQINHVPRATPPTANHAVTTAINEKAFSTEPEAIASSVPTEEDTLSAFIEELKEATSSVNEAPVPLIHPSAADALGANDASSSQPDHLTTFPDSINDNISSTKELQPPIEVVEPNGAFAESFDEIFTIERIATEFEEPDDTVSNTFEEFFSVEPVTAEQEEPDDTAAEIFDEIFTIEPLATELEASDDISSDTFEEFFSVEIASEEANASINADDATDATIDKPIISDEVLGALFDEPATEPSGEPPVAIIEQDDLLSILDEEPSNVLQHEFTLDAVTPPEEPQEPAPGPDPLEPVSGKPLKSMPPPAEEQVTQEVAASKVPLHTHDELDLNTGNEGAEPQPLSEPPTSLTDYTVPTDYGMPAELTAERPGSGAATMLWALGIVLMCGTLVLQYLYYHRLQLVENPQLRPLLTTLCELTDCELPPRRDLGRIELTEHLMQFHPNYEQSLLINATLANRADFDQPYPLVEIVMTDIEQRVVAQRRFTPEQYLHNYRRGDSFRANSEVPLQLEVLDPGNDAVGFEFRFY